MFYIGKRIGELYEVHDSDDGSVEMCSVSQLREYTKLGVRINGVVKVGSKLRVLAGSGDISKDMSMGKLMGNPLRGTGFVAEIRDGDVVLTGVEEDIFRKVFARNRSIRDILIPEGVVGISCDFFEDLMSKIPNMINLNRSQKYIDGVVFPHSLRYIVGGVSIAGMHNAGKMVFNSEVALRSDGVGSRFYANCKDLYLNNIGSCGFLRGFSGFSENIHMSGVNVFGGDMRDIDFREIHLHNCASVDLRGLVARASKSAVYISGECKFLIGDAGNAFLHANIYLSESSGVHHRLPIVLRDIPNLPDVSCTNDCDCFRIHAPERFRGSGSGSFVYYSSEDELNEMLSLEMKEAQFKLREEQRELYKKMRNQYK